METSSTRSVNNQIYDLLGERWYQADDDPVALLRAESRFRNPWILREISERLGQGPKRVLDLGCGAGFLSNELALAGHEVVGVDVSDTSLAVARLHDATASVNYLTADALALPMADQSFDVVCAMDFLEHVNDPALVIAEAGRLLRPDGLFFFYTFNRNWLSWLLVIKTVEWLVPNTPKDLHVLGRFIKPEEICEMLGRHRLGLEWISGVKPVLTDGAALKILTRRVVPREFRFEFTKSMRLAYLGIARKNGQRGA